MLIKNLKIWLIYTLNTFQQVLSNRFLMMLFLFGKTVRIFMFLIFLYFLTQNSSGIAGYNREQIIFFYLAFNFIDTAAQFFFREVYRFRPLIITGNFDFVLTKPYNPLVKVLFGGADIMDLIMLFFLSLGIFIVGSVSVSTNPLLWIVFLALTINAILLAGAFHIVVLGLGIITISIDHIIMIYRDLTALMRIPVDLYIEPLRSLLTFVLPLGIMFTFPPKVLMGLLSWQMIVLSFVISSLSLSLSLIFWRYSLRHYQSASS